MLQQDCLTGILSDWFLKKTAATKRLSQWLNNFPDAARQWAVTCGGESKAIQTAAWKLIQQDDDDSVQLYAKPDDLWESNNVSRRCPTIVEQLSDWLTRCTENSIASEALLPEELGQRFG